MSKDEGYRQAKLRNFGNESNGALVWVLCDVRNKDGVKRILFPEATQICYEVHEDYLEYI